jgi:hypothetical protein
MEGTGHGSVSSEGAARLRLTVVGGNVVAQVSGRSGGSSGGKIVFRSASIDSERA